VIVLFQLRSSQKSEITSDCRLYGIFLICISEESNNNAFPAWKPAVHDGDHDGDRADIRLQGIVKDGSDRHRDHVVRTDRDPTPYPLMVGVISKPHRCLAASARLLV
jgi:hypothetical protein